MNKEKQARLKMFEKMQFNEQKYKSNVMEWMKLLEKKTQRLQNSIECYKRFHEYDDIQHAIEDMRELQREIELFSDMQELCSHQKDFPHEMFAESGITV